MPYFPPQVSAYLETLQKPFQPFNPPLEIVFSCQGLTNYRDDYHWVTLDVASVDGEAVDASVTDTYLTGAKRAYRTNAYYDQDNRLVFTFNFASLLAAEAAPMFTYSALNHDIVLRFTFWMSHLRDGRMTPNGRLHTSHSPVIQVRA